MVRETPKFNTGLDIAFRFHFCLGKLAVLWSGKRRFTLRSIISYSMVQSFMLASYLPLLAKNVPGAIPRYANPAAPRMVDLPPPLGPTIAVTGKSKLTTRSLKPRTLRRITRLRYEP